MKKSLKNLLIIAAASASVWVGSNLYQAVNSENAKVAAPIAKSEIENPKKIFAVLANGSGPSQPKRFSEKNFNYSLLNILSFYSLLKREGVSDDDISLLVYNPANTNIFETEEYKSLLEKKLFSGVLPSKKDKIEIDGKATKKNFLNALRKIHLNSEDVIYIVISNSSPKEADEKIMYSARNLCIELDKESVMPSDLQYALKNLEQGKKIIILNDGDAANFLPSLDASLENQYFLSSSEKRELSSKKVLGISSPADYGFDKETFIMSLIRDYMKDKKQPIKKIINGLKDESYYFDKGERSLEECPWINSPLFNN